MTDDVYTACAGCGAKLPVSRLKVLPRWYPDWDCFLTNHFCEECFSAAVGEFLSDTTDDEAFRKLVEYCELHELTGLAEELRRAMGGGGGCPGPAGRQGP